jgi:hypothetical protein
MRAAAKTERLEARVPVFFKELKEMGVFCDL